jgi:hypothetical protein
VARIDAPRLNRLNINFFGDIEFDIPQFTRFISHIQMLKPVEKAHVAFGDRAAKVNLSSQTSDPYDGLNVEIRCRELDWKVLALGQVCTSCLPPLSAHSTLEHLFIYKSRYSKSNWQDYIENVPWLELLHPFTAVKNLYLSEELARHIVPALEELVGGATEVLPALQNIFLEKLKRSGPVQEGIGKFVSARQLSGHPVTVTLWEGASEQKWLYCE